MMPSKRKLERFSIKAPAKVIPIDSGGKYGDFDLVTRNICAGGVFFRTPHAIPEGTRVEVAVVLPLEKLDILKDSSKQVHLEISGWVLRSEAEGFAVCFNEDYQIRQVDPGDQFIKRDIANG